MYADSLTLNRARREFFAQTGFRENDYTNLIAKIKLGPVPIYFYNFNARRKAIAIHDVHHILTGYDTSLSGEAEVSAWELGSGYRPLDLAFTYVLIGTLTGLLFHRRKTVAAFLRGRKTRNLYGQELNAKMLGKSLGQLRRELRLNQ